MFVSVLGAILNVFLNYILIPKFGYIAAGYTTLVCYILFAVGHGCLCVSLKKMANIAQPLFSIHKIIVLVQVFDCSCRAEYYIFAGI